MWTDFSGRAFTREQFVARIAELKWTGWKPRGITLHNTAAPTLAQWAESGPAHDARIRNLQSYYEGNGWHGGPHWFISRHWINEFNNPLRRGTHSPSFNATHFGIEMVGDFEREPFNSGDGALVRDNAVFVTAVLCRTFGFDPDKDIVLHKEDPRTDHACPGKFVVKAEVIARVKAQIAVLSGKPAPAIPDRADGPPSPPPKWKAPDHDAFKDDKGPRRFTGITATVFGGADDPNASAYGGMVNPSKPGVALPFRFKGKRPKVRVFRLGKSIDCEIVDVGPWNIDDEYWKQPNERPRAERQHQNKTRDFKGRIPSNDAGIDLTQAAARAIGLVGKGKVDWEFVGTGNAAGAGTAAIVVAGGTAATQQAAQSGLSHSLIALIAIASIALAVGAWLLVRRLKLTGGIMDALKTAWGYTVTAHAALVDTIATHPKAALWVGVILLGIAIVF